MNNKTQIIKLRHLFFVLLSFLLITTSCEDVLDKENLEALTDGIWDDEDQATLYVNNLYTTNMPDDYFGTNSQLGDESYSSSTSYTYFMYGFILETDVDEVTVMHKDKYALIRRINIAIENLKSSSLSEDITNPLMGQALFFRAWRNWEMAKLYGGIPIVKSVQDPFTEDLDVARSSAKETVAAIVEDLDDAIEKLPVDWEYDDDDGRITSGAAAAFKARVLLTYASPLFNPDNDADRWQDAYDAYNQAIDLLAQMNIPRALYSNFEDIFTTDVLSNPEAIIFKRFSSSVGNDYTQGWEGDVRPPSGNGGGGYTPTWQLVSAFPMANGMLPAEEGSGYDENYFWQNRDPRFYATLAYNGDEWEMTGRDETNVWCFKNKLESNRMPTSGFYNKKATDPTIAADDVDYTSTAWIELRYAEVLLGLAECANELGKTSEAVEQVRAIRERAGIEPGDNNEYGVSSTESQEMLRQIIMIERQCEFAFENKRYWDLRRRLMFRKDLGEYVKKLNGTMRTGFKYVSEYDTIINHKKRYWSDIIKDESSPFYGSLRMDTVLYYGHMDIDNVSTTDKYFTKETKTLDTYSGSEQEINYPELYDFFAIPSTIIESSLAVEQTIGWQYGTFDPLAD